MTIQIYDILKNEKWKKKVLDTIPEILSSGHFNAKNYETLESRLIEYECFTAIVEDKRLLAISGLYNGGIYPEYTARILDRTYYYDWNKNGGMVSPYNNNLRYNTFYAIPYQMKVAEERGFESVFISMQNPKKRNTLVRLTNKQPEYKFEMLQDLYNTSKPNKNGEYADNHLSWQSISIYYLTEKKRFDLPKISIDEYYERYKDIARIR